MKSVMKIYRFVRPYLAKYRRQITAFLFVATIFYSLSLVQPFILGQFVDKLMTDINTATIWRCCTIFLLVAVLNVVLAYYVKITGTRLNCQTAGHMKMLFCQHLQKTSPRFHMQKEAGEMANKINNDSEYLIIFLLNLGLQLPGKLVCFVLGTAYIFYVDFWCGVAVLAFLPLLGLLYHLFKERMYNAMHAATESRTEYFVALEDQFKDLRSIRINHLTDVLGSRFMKVVKKTTKLDVGEDKVCFPYSIINQHMDTILQVFLFAYGGFSVLHSRMTLGEFTILYSYMSIITSSFSYFLSVGKDVQQHMSYYTRLKELADVPEEGNGTALPQELTEVSAENIHFGYDDREVLRGFTQKFEKGRIYCLAGQNGSGKSTLANLLLGLYVGDTGDSVRYNGIPIRDVDLYRMRGEMIGVSEQEPTMLSGTVGFNVTYQEEGPYDTAKLSQLFRTVGFSNGEITADSPEDLLALDASALSGGQKQKVSIIKALYKNPQLLLLDEPTSALDAASREKLAAYLRETAANRITILISHDQELLDLADETIRLTDCPMQP